MIDCLILGLPVGGQAEEGQVYASDVSTIKNILKKILS